MLWFSILIISLCYLSMNLYSFVPNGFGLHRFLFIYLRNFLRFLFFYLKINFPCHHTNSKRTMHKLQFQWMWMENEVETGATWAQIVHEVKQLKLIVSNRFCNVCILLYLSIYTVHDDADLMFVLNFTSA